MIGYLKRVGGRPLHFPLIKTDGTYSILSPADALIQQLTKIEYKKHLDNLTTVVLTIAAVVYVFAQMFAKWYQNGGKDLTIQYLQKVWQILTVCYVWVLAEGIPNLKNLKDQTVKIYQDWKGLVTV